MPRPIPVDLVNCTTYTHLLQAFDWIGAELHYIRTTLQIPDDDARQVALRGMQEVVGGYAMGLSSMTFGRSQQQIIDSFGRTNLTPDEARRIVEDAWKLGLMTLFHFKLDALFQNLLRALGQYDNSTRAFSAMVDRMLRIAMFADPSTSRDVLLLLGYLRNSQHNNGMHRGQPLTIVLQGMTFELVKDQPVDCASWLHVFAAIGGTLGALEEIFASPKIQALAVPVRDEYAATIN